MGCNPDDMARSMMVLLLPSAVPLLSKTCKQSTENGDQNYESGTESMIPAEEKNYNSYLRGMLGYWPGISYDFLFGRNFIIF